MSAPFDPAAWLLLAEQHGISAYATEQHLCLDIAKVTFTPEVEEVFHQLRPSLELDHDRELWEHLRAQEALS